MGALFVGSHANQVHDMMDEVGESALEESLQNFANRVGIICALEHGDKIAPHEAYQQIKELFKELKGVKRSVYPRSC